MVVGWLTLLPAPQAAADAPAASPAGSVVTESDEDRAADQRDEAYARDLRTKASPADAVGSPGPSTPSAHATPQDGTEPSRAVSGSSSRPVHIGASVSAGLPHPVTYSLDLKIYDVIGLSAEYGKVATREYRGYHLTDQNLDARLRWFPAGGSFFFGVAYGEQKLSLSSKQKINLAAPGEASSSPEPEVLFSFDMKSRYVTPHLGWFYRADSGFVLGFEAGYQITKNAQVSNLQVTPADATTNLNDVKSSRQYKAAEQQADDKIRVLSEKGIPYVDILRLGWMF